jgi:hypothetical protein
MATEARLERAVLAGVVTPEHDPKLSTPEPFVCRQVLAAPSAVGRVSVRALAVAPLWSVRVFPLVAFLNNIAPVALLAVPSVNDDEAGIATPSPDLPKVILVALAAPIVIAPPELPLSKASVFVPEACSTPLMVIAPVDVLALKAVRLPPAFWIAKAVPEVSWNNCVPV